jgi:hypothetical protein
MTMKKKRTGADTNSAVPSECPSAIPFGTSSPMTTCRKDQVGEDHGEHRRNRFVEKPRERHLAERTDAQRSERHAELHRRDEARWVGGDT